MSRLGAWPSRRQRQYKCCSSQGWRCQRCCLCDPIQPLKASYSMAPNTKLVQNTSELGRFFALSLFIFFSMFLFLWKIGRVDVYSTVHTEHHPTVLCSKSCSKHQVMCCSICMINCILLKNIIVLRYIMQ